jgi:hypothetical protein
MMRRRNRGFSIADGGLDHLPYFPVSVVPALWLDGERQAFSDAGGTVPINSGQFRRIAEPPVPGGRWTSPSDNERPSKDTGSVRMETIGPAGGQSLFRDPAVGISKDACTLIVSYVARDNAFAGVNMGLLYSTDTKVGLRIGSNAVSAYYGGANWVPGLTVTPGARNTIGIRYTPSGMSMRVNAGGVISNASLSTAITASSVAGAWYAGQVGAGYLYGSIAQAIGVGRALTDAEFDAAMTYAHARPAPDAYPNDRALIAYVGDSIARMTACEYGLGYPFLALNNIRATKPLTENCDCAIGGAGVSGMLTPSVNNQFYLAKSFYSAARVKNIMVLALGSNDLANGNGAAFTVRGSAPPSVPGSGLFPMCDAARAQGWKVVLLTIGPRQANITQATFNADRLAANTIILSEGLQHADAVVNTTNIVNFGFDNDYFNGTYYSGDLIHPIAPGHALVEPVLTPALLSLL